MEHISIILKFEDITRKIYNKLHVTIWGDVFAFVLAALFFTVPYILSIHTRPAIKTVYILIRTISELSLWFVCGYIIYGIYALVRRKKIEHLKIRCVWIAILLLLSLPHIPKVYGYYSTQIGDFYEGSDYTENYVIFMSREPEANKNRKVYILTAQISRFEEETGTDTSIHYITGEHNEKPIKGLFYHIDKIYFSNGGYIDFTDVDSRLRILNLDIETKICDNNGDSYYVTLTSQKSK